MKMMISSMHYCFGFPNIFVFFSQHLFNFSFRTTSDGIQLCFIYFHFDMPVMAFNTSSRIMFSISSTQKVHHVDIACNGLDIFSLNQTFRYACVTKGTDFAHMYSSSSEKRYRLHVFQVK
jgi:hypothetical protein